MKSKTCLMGVLLSFLFNFQAHAQDVKRYAVSGNSLQELRRELRNRGEHVQDLKYASAVVAQLTPARLRQLEARYSSLVFEADNEVHLLGKPVKQSPQPVQSTPWGLTAVGADQAYGITRGAGVTVCIVDTGIQANHPDLAGQVIGGENFVVSRGTANPSAWADDNNHGTHVAGTVAALDNSIGVVGVAPQAKLFAAKVLDKRGSGYSSWVADGIYSCVRNQTQVISMSLGSASSSSLIRDAVVAASRAGIIVVAAAGNEGGAVGYPAAYPEVLAISAVDSSLKFASFSNSGPEIDFAAPGVGVLSTIRDGLYGTYSGTSMATPHVSGVVALVLSIGRAQIIANDIGLPWNQQGYGLVSAIKSVQ